VLLIVTPTAPDSPTGNGVTARRWAAILRDLGHQVHLSQDYQDGDYDALIALHAVKSAPAVRAFGADHPAAPIVIALTGTDLYPSLAAAGVDRSVLALGRRLVVLQPHGRSQLPPEMASRTRVIIQSVTAIPRAPARTDCFEIAFLAHLRPVKDPLLLATAVRRLPASSRIRVTHAGEARDPALAASAAAASAANDRYDWLGPLPRRDALAILARSRILALTSVQEGGANVVSEALAAGVPIISSAIPGSTGLLGSDYPGYFRPGDAAHLASVLHAAEENSGGFYQRLRERCAVLRPLVDPARERHAWASVLAELGLLPTLPQETSMVTADPGDEA
jgi:putative glycosyltransferase (TIGR04348 family)